MRDRNPRIGERAVGVGAIPQVRYVSSIVKKGCVEGKSGMRGPRIRELAPTQKVGVRLTCVNK